jgi:hypothetical protein
LIAWISADPHLRSIVASHRREAARPLPPRTRAAKAAVAACIVLACSTALGITATVNEGLLAPLANNPSPVVSQDTAAGPGRPADRVPAVSGPDPTVFPAPAATQSMVLNPPDGPSHHIAADDASSSPVGHVGSSVAIPTTDPASPHRADTPHPARQITPIKPADGKPGATGTLASSGKATDSADPTDRDKLPGSGNPAGTGKPASSGNSTDSNNPAGSGNPPSTTSPGEMSKPGGSGKPIALGAAGDDGGTHNGVATPGVKQSPSSPPPSSPRISRPH